ncbi:hypothetical protein [Clostridium butyricum]|uniref:hypothetical protein n=1 Tax=Clostridium butyricum TaxID=1492 RepID=UPI002ABD4DE6|nr:hypothetical protein [Clostridium butyricum]
MVLLLQLIKDDENITILKRYGLEYYQIAEYLKFLLKEKYLEMSMDKLLLTEKGIKKIELTHLKNKNQWIKPLYEMKVKKIDKYDIYIP